MRILLINHYAGSPEYGMELRPYYLSREWVRDGHQVSIVGSSESHLRRKTPLLSGSMTRESIDGVEYIWLHTPKYSGNGIKRTLNMVGFVTQVYRFNSKFITNGLPQAVIASSTYPLDILPAAHIARRAGALLLFEVHDLWPLSPMQLGSMPWWHPFIVVMQIAENMAYRKADIVVSLLPKAEPYMRRHGLAKSKFYYIPNGIDISAWDWDAAELPCDHQNAIEIARQRGLFKIAYTGAHGIANALHSLVDAAAILHEKPFAFFFVGDGQEKKRLKLISKKNDLTNVFFLPPVPKKCMSRLLESMDALYIGLQRQPLFQFGISPNKLLEYMMAAKPIVFAIEAGNDMVTETRCGISVAPEDPHAIAFAIERLASLQPHIRNAMGVNGKKYVSTYHNYKVLAKDFMDLIIEKYPQHK